MSGFSQAQAIISAMITPALLILASASLIATVLVRLARVVDRVRKIVDSAPAAAGELSRLERRALLAERAVQQYFLAIVSSVIAGFSIGVDHLTGDHFAWLPVAATSAGMLLIVAGSWGMLEECRLATEQIRTAFTDLKRCVRPEPVAP